MSKNKEQFIHLLKKKKEYRIFEQQKKQNKEVAEWLNNHKKEIESWHKPERMVRRQQIENELIKIAYKFNLR
jgi:predicted alpha/beta hydrolase family esterase